MRGSGRIEVAAAERKCSSSRRTRLVRALAVIAPGVLNLLNSMLRSARP
jgi:hypothetical protein